MNTLPAFEEYGSKRGGRNVAPALQILQLANYQRLERRCCWKQSSQYTGLSPRGKNGTLASSRRYSHRRRRSYRDRYNRRRRRRSCPDRRSRRCFGHRPACAPAGRMDNAWAH